MSELAEKLIAENLKTKNPVLDLGRCALTPSDNELYKPLKDATYLKTLIFSDEWEEYDTQQQVYIQKESQNPDLHKKEQRNIFYEIPILPKNLKTLILAGHWDSLRSVLNLSSLAELKQLQYLDLSYNHIAPKDYNFNSFFSKLKQLKKLRLAHTLIKNFAFLRNLTELEELDLSDNTDYPYSKDLVINDIVGENKTLSKLFQHRHDFSFLSALKKLKVLDVSNNKLEDTITSFLIYLYNSQKLESLALSSNKIPKITPIIFKKINQLQSLNLYNNELEDISFLIHLTSLQKLDLSHNKFKDISPLVRLTNLRELNLGNNDIDDYSYLQELKQLESLTLSANFIKDISFLENLTNLKYLNINYNQIKDISPLKNLKKLESLGFYGNKVQNIDILKNLENLNSVNLSFNALDYPPISIIYLQKKGGKLGDYIHLPERSQVAKIWQLMSSNDKKDMELAHQLALGQGWMEEDFEMYQNLVY